MYVQQLMKKAIQLKESKEGYVGGFGRQGSEGKRG